ELGTEVLAVRLVGNSFCHRTTVDTFQQRVERTRSVNKLVVALEYVAGITLGASGAFLVIDKQGARENITPVRDLTDDQLNAAGGALVGVGGLALIAAIIDSTRGGSSTKVYPAEKAV